MLNRSVDTAKRFIVTKRKLFKVSFEKLSKTIYSILGVLIEIMMSLIASSWLITKLFPNIMPNQEMKFGVIILLLGFSIWMISIVARWIFYKYIFNQEKKDVLLWWNYIRNIRYFWIKGLFMLVGFFVISGLTELIESTLVNLDNNAISQIVSIAFDLVSFALIVFFIWSWYFHKKTHPNTKGLFRWLAEFFFGKSIFYDKKFAYRLSRIEEIDRMSGRQFEVFMAGFFSKKGYSVSMTPASNDFGADLILNSSSGSRIVVQLKRYSDSVGKSAIQEVAGARDYYKANHAMAIATNFFTNGAKAQAIASRVELWDRERLIQEVARINAELSARSS